MSIGPTAPAEVVSSHHSSARGAASSSWGLRHGLPLLPLTLVLALLAVGVERRAELSVQPPPADAVSYIQKARSFWDAVAHRRWVSPLGLEPTMRPPGTILLSGPLGFDPDPRGFLARSVWVPSGILALAVWIVGGPFRDRSSAWRTAAMAAGMASIPCFFQLEIRDQSPVTWGLVDNFLAATTALAAAIGVRSATAGSWPGTFVATLLGAFGVLVKPIGVVLVPLLALTWLLSAPRKMHTIVRGLLLHAVVAGGTVVLALRSPYLGAANLEFGRRSSEQVREIWTSGQLWRVLADHSHPSFGWHVLAFLIVGLVVSLRGAGRGWRPVGDVVAAAAFVAVGAIVWVGFTGVSIRYLYPFVLPPMVLLSPRATDGWSSFTALSKLAATVPVLPAAALVFLLWSPEPPATVQRALGVDLTVGSYPEESALARVLLGAARAQHQQVRLYSFYTGDFRELIPVMAAEHAGAVGGRYPVISRVPIDWGGISAFRLHEIAAADYIVFRPIPADVAAAVLASREVPDLFAEGALFRAWAQRADDADGLSLAHNGGTLRLLRVTDRPRLTLSLRRLSSSRSFGADFRLINARWLADAS